MSGLCEQDWETDKCRTEADSSSFDRIAFESKTGSSLVNVLPGRSGVRVVVSDDPRKVPVADPEDGHRDVCQASTPCPSLLRCSRTIQRLDCSERIGHPR